MFYPGALNQFDLAANLCPVESEIIRQFWSIKGSSSLFLKSSAQLKSLARSFARLEKSFEPEIKVSETFEFESMKSAYLKQAEELKALRETLEAFAQKLP